MVSYKKHEEAMSRRFNKWMLNALSINLITWNYVICRLWKWYCMWLYNFAFSRDDSERFQFSSNKGVVKCSWGGAVNPPNDRIQGRSLLKHMQSSLSDSKEPLWTGKAALSITKTSAEPASPNSNTIFMGKTFKRTWYLFSNVLTLVIKQQWPVKNFRKSETLSSLFFAKCIDKITRITWKYFAWDRVYDDLLPLSVVSKTKTNFE